MKTNSLHVNNNNSLLQEFRQRMGYINHFLLFGITHENKERG